MLVACWSVKGGSGTTVVAAALAVMLARRSPEGAVLADLSGDGAAVLGLPEPGPPGLAGWLASGADVPADALARLEVPAARGLALLPRGVGALAAARARVLAGVLDSGSRPVVADCGVLAAPISHLAPDAGSGRPAGGDRAAGSWPVPTAWTGSEPAAGPRSEPDAGPGAAPAAGSGPEMGAGTATEPAARPALGLGAGPDVELDAGSGAEPAARPAVEPAGMIAVGLDAGSGAEPAARPAVDLGTDAATEPAARPALGLGARSGAEPAAVGAVGATSSPPAGGSADPTAAAVALAAAARRSILVTRPCYLALRRAHEPPLHPTEVVVVHEPGRALGRAEIERIVSAPVVAEVAIDPVVARAVDAGLLAGRLPRSLERSLRHAA